MCGQRYWFPFVSCVWLVTASSWCLADGWPETQISSGSADDRMPDVAVGADGVVHIVFHREAPKSLQYTNNAAGDFATPTAIPLAEPPAGFSRTGFGFPRITVASDGTPRILYMAAYTNYDTLEKKDILYVSTLGGDAETVVDNFDLVSVNEILTDATGTFHVVFMARLAVGQPWHVYYSSGTTEFLGYFQLSTQTNAAAPYIALDGDNFPHVSYWANDSGTPKYFYATSRSGSWVSQEVAETNRLMGTPFDTRIAATASGNAGIVYQKAFGSSDWDVYFTPFSATGVKGTEELLADSPDRLHFGGLDADSAGHLHLVYGDEAGNLYYIENTIGTWSSPSSVTPSGQSGGECATYIDSSDIMHVVFRRRLSSSDTDIYLARHATPTAVCIGDVQMWCTGLHWALSWRSYREFAGYRLSGQTNGHWRRVPTVPVKEAVGFGEKTEVTIPGHLRGITALRLEAALLDGSRILRRISLPRLQQ